MAPRIDPKWKASPVTASSRKRCPQCDRMVEAGEPAVLRDARWVATSGRTPWVGNRRSYARGAWKLYHPACFDQLVEVSERIAARYDAEYAERFARVAPV